MAAGERGGRGGEDRGKGMKGRFRRWKRGGHLVGYALFCFKLKGGDELGLQASGCRWTYRLLLRAAVAARGAAAVAGLGADCSVSSAAQPIYRKP